MRWLVSRATVSLPWEGGKKRHSVEKNDGWQLYNTKSDYSLTNDLASQYPEKLETLKKAFMKEAVANYVLPLDDRLTQIDTKGCGRQTLMGDRTKLVLYPRAYNLLKMLFLTLRMYRVQ